MKKTAPEILAASVSERDIDLLLLEEFVSSNRFVQWFLRHAQLPDLAGARVIRAQHAATVSNGESDLEITVRQPKAKQVSRILIENKVASGFQPKQAERYAERGKSYVAQCICRSFHTVLVAPERYLGPSRTAKGFDSAVTYEEMRQWYEEKSELGARAAYKIRLLSAAIEKATQGWQVIEDVPVTRFWQRYWELVCELAPELEMDRPSPKPARSSFIRLRAPRLPDGVSLLHKVAYGNVDLQFANMGDDVAKLRAKYSQSKKSWMQIDRAANSAVIRAKVRPINMADDLEANREPMILGIKRAQSLYHWFMAQDRRPRKAGKQLK